MAKQSYTVPISVNNVVGRSKPITIKSGLRFPHTKEIEEIVAEVAPHVFDQENSLVDRFFPTDQTFASEIEMYMVRRADGEGAGMTFVHQTGSNALPIDVRASKFDLAKASWSPVHFKEARVWDEQEMERLGRLTEEVQQSQIDEHISDSIAWILKRMKNRRDDMVWQVLTTGQIAIAAADASNPNGLEYTINYQLSNMELALANLFTAKDATTGKSLEDPIQYFIDLREAARWKPELRPVEIIVNSQFIDVLADNTFVQYIVDYERGWTAVDMRPPRSVYREAALGVFTRFTGLKVTINDETYIDENNAVQFWIPAGRMVIVNENPGPVGRFIYTAHLAGADDQGNIRLGTGPYLHVEDKTKGDPPFYKIIGGFNGLPRVDGYNPRDFSHNRLKWLTYADATVATGYSTAFPADSYNRPLGPVASPSGR